MNAEIQGTEGNEKRVREIVEYCTGVKGVAKYSVEIKRVKKTQVLCLEIEKIIE